MFSGLLQSHKSGLTIAVMPMESVTPPAVDDRASKVRILTDPIHSTEASKPITESGITLSVPTTPRHSTCSTKGVPPVRFTPSKK